MQIASRKYGEYRKKLLGNRTSAIPSGSGQKRAAHA